MKKQCCKDNPRLGKVGGQAVIEGVMMKAGDRTVTTCRKEDGSLVVTDGEFHSVRKKYKILNIPILRGVINFVEMMILSFKTLSISADALDLDEGSKKKNEDKKDGAVSAFTTAIMVVASVLGVALSLFLFMFLPTFLADLADKWITLGVWRAVLEGMLKIAIFILYLCLVTLMKDIRRTFMYHGAEHKSIACFEAGDELTPENAAKHRRFHPRCGTSFMFLMILLGVVAGLFIRVIDPTLGRVAYISIRLGILPLIMGLGYEFILFAGKHDNIVTRVVSAPGLWVQRITTKEPTEDMLEVAIISIKCALRDDFPEFGEFYKARPWEKKNESEEAADAEAEDAKADVTEIDETAACGEADNTEADAMEEVGSCTEPKENSKDTAEPSI